jgi:DNA-binding LytR/AlgR family response regulator
MTCYIIDDEPKAIAIISSHIGQITGLQLIGSATSPQNGLAAILQLRPDLVILDMQMPGLSGLEVFKALQIQPLYLPRFIFTTAHLEYAKDYILQGIDQRVIDFLLKPVDFDRFVAAIQKGKQAGTPATNSDTSPGGLLLRSGQKNTARRVPFNEILYLESEGNYCYIYTADSKLVESRTLKEISGLLPPADFIRVHKSFIVSKTKVAGVENGSLLLTNEKLIPIGRIYRKQASNILIPQL